MATKTYNGWTNYETWAVALWIDNEEGSQNYWQDEARRTYKVAYATSYATKREMAKFALADAMKEEFEQSTPEVTGLWADLLSAALSEVDWHEVADHYLDDVE